MASEEHDENGVLGGDQEMTTVVHCKREPYDVYVGRGSKWGNPFKIGVDGTREEVCKKYKHWFLTQVNLICQLDELRGKVLGCWCYPKQCHAEFLAEYTDLCFGDNDG